MTTPKELLPYAVLMAGGSGTRLWPISTAEKPKQFIELFGTQSLIQLTAERIASLLPPSRILVLTGERFRTEVERQLPEVPAENVIAEPVPRDTAGAVALAAAVGRRRFPGGTMVVLPADHIIQPVERFRDTVQSAIAGAAEGDALYTFGIQPTYAATGYGYLERGEPVTGSAGEQGHFHLLRFREKPDRETAQQFIDSGRFYWNSGMFVWRNETIWKAIETHLPAHAAALGPLTGTLGEPGWEAQLARAFAAVPKISIDYGVMEKWHDVKMVEGRFEWCDVGGWPAVADFLAKDSAGNAHRGRLEHVDAANNIVFSADPEETIALVGLRDVVVVRAGKRTLVMDRQRAEEVKLIAQRLSE